MMDPWKKDFGDSSSINPTSSSEMLRQRLEVEIKNPIVARKVQKADREKLRRDRLNEHFIELGNKLDPDRPKNDKATILNDTIQTLKDLGAEVKRLKTEYNALSEESRELTQEKNELREEKASLKSDIDNLNVQYQQRLGSSMYPWTGIDPNVLMASPYSFPVPVPVIQPFPFFGTQNNPATLPSPCPTYIPYPSPPIDQTSAPASQISVRPDSRSKSISTDKCDGSNDVATELELKTPGSANQQDVRSSGQKKGKQPQKKERSVTIGSCPSRDSLSQGFQDSSSNSSTSDAPKSDKLRTC